MGSYSQTTWPPSWAYATEASDPYSGYHQYPSYSSYLAESMDAYQTHHHHLVHHHQMSRTTESKPRLSKEEVEILEAEFQKNHKPNSSLKKALAEQMRVDNARINNWFQNRRAREKKEKNIREYEAKQKLEKERNEASGLHPTQPDRKSDLVPSSAPFPNTQRSASLVMVKREASSDAMDSECLSDENAESGLGFPRINGSTARDARGECTSPSNDASDANDNDFALSTDDEDAATGFSSRNPIFSYGSGPMNGYPPVSGDENGLRSPASLDIAGRRNRRPPPLSINESRSYSAGAPRTGIDMVKRGDTMRRVNSATGSMRITKPMAAPRSPFQLSRSPVTAGPRGSHAPPTPDTPILANQPNGVSANALESNTSISELVIRDPTLRTPPTTPGGVHNFFSLNSVYGMPVSEENMVTPLLHNYQNGFEVPNMPMAVPNYLSTTNAVVSQPQTPSFVSPASATSSYGMSSANTEYTWPTSRTTSPAEQQGPQYLNLPVASFGMER